jgi:hypothetical protein
VFAAVQEEEEEEEVLVLVLFVAFYEFLLVGGNTCVRERSVVLSLQLVVYLLPRGHGASL